MRLRSSESHPQGSQAGGQLLCLGLLGSQVHEYAPMPILSHISISNALVRCGIHLLTCSMCSVIADSFLRA